jgi:hypothetical protein
VEHPDEGKALNDQRVDGARRRHDLYLRSLRVPPHLISERNHRELAAASV